MGNLRDRLGRIVPQHDGSAHDPRQLFFGPTHVAVIGPIMSAHSNRTRLLSSHLTRIFGTWTCSYVGRRGVVIHEQRGQGELTTRLLRFSEVEQLPEHVFQSLPGGAKLRKAARAAWQRELLRRRVTKSMSESEFKFALGYQPAT